MRGPDTFEDNILRSFAASFTCQLAGPEIQPFQIAHVSILLEVGLLTHVYPGLEHRILFRMQIHPRLVLAGRASAGCRAAQRRRDFACRQ